MICIWLLDLKKTRGLLFFHAFTGCDVVSAFRGRGKKSAWQTWAVCSEASEAFSQLSQYQPTIDDAILDVLEQFVVLLYDRSSTATGVDEARLEMFARKQRSYQAIPPTRAALLQHTKRAAYQAGCVWRQATLCEPEEQSPADWGWTKKGDQWQVIWTTLRRAARSSPSVDVILNAGDAASATDMDLPVQHYAAASVRTRHHDQRLILAHRFSNSDIL